MDRRVLGVDVHLGVVGEALGPTVQVAVDDSPATAAPASSGGTPGWGVTRNAAMVSVSLGS